MGKISDNWYAASGKNLALSDVKMNASLVANLETDLGLVGVHDYKVNSAFRNYIPKGGSKTSDHLNGNAVDIGLSLRDIASVEMSIEANKSYWMGRYTQIGFYPWGIHFARGKTDVPFLFDNRATTVGANHAEQSKDAKTNNNIFIFLLIGFILWKI